MVMSLGRCTAERPRKYDQETRDRAVRMYQDRRDRSLRFH